MSVNVLDELALSVANAPESDVFLMARRALQRAFRLGAQSRAPGQAGDLALLKKTGFENVADEIASKYSVTVEALLSRSRKSSLRIARRELVCALHARGLTYKTIGLVLGRDAVTVLQLAQASVPRNAMEAADP